MCSLIDPALQGNVALKALLQNKEISDFVLLQRSAIKEVDDWDVLYIYNMV